MTLYSGHTLDELEALANALKDSMFRQERFEKQTALNAAIPALIAHNPLAGKDDC